MEISPYITKALECFNLLTVIEFIEIANYPIDAFMINKFWATIEDDKLIYVDDELIRWMGYDSVESKNRKMTFMKLLNDKQYYYYTNDEYARFIEKTVLPIGITEIYPQVDRSNGKGKTKHLLLPADTLKMVMMQVSTNRGNEVRKYFLSLEKLFKIYIRYQNKYKQLQTDTQLEENTKQLTLKNQQLQEQDQLLNRISLFNEELMDKQKFTTKDEILYIGSTYDCARQGLFKASKTKDIRLRNATHNTTHPVGDEFVILHTVKCSDALQLEQRIKHILKYWRPSTSREYYKIPYILLVDVIELLANDMSVEEEFINSKIDEYKKNKISANQINYLECAPIDRFKLLPTPTLEVDQPILQITFTITGWSREQTEDFMRNVLADYKLSHKKHSWKTLYEFIKNRLNMKRHGLAANKDKLIQTCQSVGINIK